MAFSFIPGKVADIYFPEGHDFSKPVCRLCRRRFKPYFLPGTQLPFLGLTARDIITVLNQRLRLPYKMANKIILRYVYIGV
jgi:hypothetical protein